MNILMKNANVFDVYTGKFIPECFIYISDGVFQFVGSNPKEVQADQVLDVTGKWIIPGMINLHEHQTYKRLVGPLFGQGGVIVNATESNLTLRAVRSALFSLRQGITTIFEAGDLFSVSFSMRSAISQGLIPGPRMLISGQAISITGGHACDLCIEVDSCDEMRKTVRKQLKKGVDFIKLYSSAEPVVVRSGEPVIAEMTDDMVSTAVTEVHNVHKRVAIHAMGTEQLTRSIRAGVDVIHHGAYLSNALASQMREKGIVLVPTLSSYRMTAHQVFNRGAAWSEAHKLLWPGFDSAFKAAMEEGVTLAVGTDSVGDFVEELEMMQKLGLSSAECIRVATLNGAVGLALKDQLGSIEIGKIADLVVLNGNPLLDLSLLRDIAFVIKDGKVYDIPNLTLQNVAPDSFVERVD